MRLSCLRHYIYYIYFLSLCLVSFVLNRRVKIIKIKRLIYLSYNNMKKKKIFFQVIQIYEEKKEANSFRFRLQERNKSINKCGVSSLFTPKFSTYIVCYFCQNLSNCCFFFIFCFDYQPRQSCLFKMPDQMICIIFF